MSDAKTKRYRADRMRDAYIAFSLNDLDAEGNEYLAQLPDPHDAFREIEDEQDIETLLKDVMPALTEQQRKHLVRLAEGRKTCEMVQEMHVPITKFWEDRKAIRKATAEVISRESFGGGGYLIYGQAGCY